MKAKMLAIFQHDIGDVFAYKLCKCTKALTRCYGVITIIFITLAFLETKNGIIFLIFLMSTAKNLFVF
jgi:hypothetical protein